MVGGHGMAGRARAAAARLGHVDDVDPLDLLWQAESEASRSRSRSCARGGRSGRGSRSPPYAGRGGGFLGSGGGNGPAGARGRGRGGGASRQGSWESQPGTVSAVAASAAEADPLDTLDQGALADPLEVLDFVERSGELSEPTGSRSRVARGRPIHTAVRTVQTHCET
jgi:hypothetical protein